MKLLKKPVIISTVVAVALSGVLLTNTSFAATAKKKIEVAFNNIKVKYNGKEVAIDASLEPFTINGTTFIPLRAMGNVFGKKVAWDAAAKTVNVSDTTTADATTIASLQSQVSAKTMEINSLNAQVLILRNELERANSSSNGGSTTKPGSSYDIDDLEADLNDSYYDYKDLDADITLNGDEDSVTVTIKVNPDSWADLSTSKQEAFLQDIIDDILDEYEDTDIEGVVKSDEDKSTLLKFSIDKNGDIEIGDVISIEDLQDELNDDFGDYQSLDFDIELSGNEDKVKIKVFINKKDWNNLSSSKKSTFENDLLDAVEDAYSDATISGSIYSEDNEKLDTF